MRVAVLGAGYAGLTLARKLAGTLPDEAELVVVDERDDHLLQHELHRVIRRPDLADEITVSLDGVLDCELRRARVTDVDPGDGVATLEGNELLDYDVGAVCLGAETAYHGLSGVREHATPLKRLGHARRIRADYRSVLDDDGRVVVGGAGLSGVQVAGELAAMAREEAADPEIVVLERLGTVAPGFPEPFRDAVGTALEDRGVSIRTDAAVQSAGPQQLVLAGGETLAYDQLIWTGGIRGPDVLSGDRPVVRSDLRLAGDTFAIGDVGRVVDVEGQSVPASAQSAIREADVCARNLRALVEHRLSGSGGFEPRLDRFTFDARGWLVSVGDGAVALVGTRVLTGRAALALKTSIGAGYLGSVGAVENALDLVREELGLIAGDDGNANSEGETGTEDERAGGEERTGDGDENARIDETIRSDDRKNHEDGN